MNTLNINTIDDVIKELDYIISISKEQGSPLGYFAALYRKVTIKVKEGIANGEFENGERMEKLDVIFASRYIDAYHNYFNNKQTSLSWIKAFKLANNYWPIVLQHLLIGMNAHINLDLGVAAAQVMEGQNIDDLKDDFNKINNVLASLVANVEKDLSDIWPTLKYILKFTKKVDDFLINFAMREARDGAWKFAVKLSHIQNQHELALAIAHRDQRIDKIGSLVTHQGLILSIVFGFVRLGEKGNIVQKINDLID